MNIHKFVFVFLVVGSGLLLSACGVKDKVEQKIGEKILEEQIEKQTGNEVDIDNENGNVTIKTEEGGVQYSAGGNVSIPEGFPREMLIGKDIKPIMATVSNKNFSLTYNTTDDKSWLFEEFKRLTNSGWKKDMELSTDDGVMLSFSKNTEKATISIGKSDENDGNFKATVSVILVVEE